MVMMAWWSGKGSAWTFGDHFSTFIMAAKQGLIQRRYKDHNDHKSSLV
jgi:hypothetical protein